VKNVSKTLSPPREEIRCPVSLTEINTWPSGFRCDLIVSPLRIHFIDRIDTIEHQVHEDLLQLYPSQ